MKDVKLFRCASHSVNRQPLNWQIAFIYLSISFALT